MSSSAAPSPSRRPRLTPFFVAAALLHGALALHQPGAPPTAAGPPLGPPENLIDLWLEPLEADPPSPSPKAPEPSTPHESPPRPALAARTLAKIATDPLGDKAKTSSASEAPPEPGAAARSPSLEGKATGAASAEAPRAIDFSLGRLGEGWTQPSPNARPGGRAPLDLDARADQELRRAQDEHDRELGLGWTGNVLNALYTTEIRNSAPPGEGTAQIEIEFGPNGQAKGVRVVSGTGGEINWQTFADLCAAALKRKPLTGLGSARGARALIEVRMTERFPDGSKPGPNAYHKPCEVGYCGGVESDPSNLGAKIIRLMHASLVRAERL